MCVAMSPFEFGALIFLILCRVVFLHLVGVSGVKPHEDEQVALASVKALLSGVSKL